MKENIKRTGDVYTILKQKYKDVKNFNEDYLIWYVTYIYESIIEKKLLNKKSENHHFLPKGDFPEYHNLNRNPFNKAILKSRDHFIAHYLLYKAAPTKVNIFAFNQMKRVLDKNDRDDIELSSRLYEEARFEINNLMSEINIGRKRRPEVVEAMSKRTKGKVIVYATNDPLKQAFQVDVTDPRYISGEYVPRNTGTKHKKETIDKMIMNSGIVDKSQYYHEETRKIKFFGENDIIPKEYIKGIPEECKLAASIRITGLNYYHNPKTLEQNRFYDGQEPDGWIKGKPYFGKNGNPFATNKIYRNFITNETGMVLLNDPYPKYCGNSAVKPNSRYAYMYKNYVCFNPAHISKVLNFPEHLVFIICSRIKVGTENRPIKLNYIKEEYRVFLKNYNCYGDIGISILPLPEFLQLENYEQFEWIG